MTRKAKYPKTESIPVKAASLKLFLFSICVFSLLPVLAHALQPAMPGRHNNSNPPDSKYKEGELLVKFKSGTPEEIKDKIHEMMGSEVIKEFRSIQVQHVRLKKGLSVEEAIRLYKADPNVEYAEPNYIVEIQK